jgi:hypothetical protein
MSKIINVELKEKLEKLYSDIYDLLGSEEFDNERDRVEGFSEKEWDKLSEEEIEYCLLFQLDNLRSFINDVS